MQAHYGFRGFKSKLELFLKLAISFFLAHFFPPGKGVWGGNLIVTVRTWDAGEMGFAHSFLA